MSEEYVYWCKACGYTHGNTATWCEGGCGRDYNEMIRLPKWQVDKFVAAIRKTAREVPPF